MAFLSGVKLVGKSIPTTCHQGVVGLLRWQEYGLILVLALIINETINVSVCWRQDQIEHFPNFISECRWFSVQKITALGWIQGLRITTIWDRYCSQLMIVSSKGGLSPLSLTVFIPIRSPVSGRCQNLPYQLNRRCGCSSVSCSWRTQVLSTETIKTPCVVTRSDSQPRCLWFFERSLSACLRVTIYGKIFDY